jgi:hypothetical protein
MSTAAAAAAAARRRREEEEEEHMTTYTPRDLAENWEFKILRSNTGAFKDPAVMQRYLEEEARAGWTLVEKFDNSRIRLKRPAAARQQDAQCTFDPYRTRVGISQVGLGLLIAVSILGGLAVLFTVIIIIVKAGGR